MFCTLSDCTLYSFLLSESSNYKLGRLNIKYLLWTHWLTDSLTNTTYRVPSCASTARAKNQTTFFWKQAMSLGNRSLFYFTLGVTWQSNHCLTYMENGCSIIRKMNESMNENWFLTTKFSECEEKHINCVRFKDVHIMTANEQKYPNVNKIQTNEMENWLKEGVIKNTKNKSTKAWILTMFKQPCTLYTKQQSI